VLALGFGIVVAANRKKHSKPDTKEHT
jgi:hypothetical protein